MRTTSFPEISFLLLEQLLVIDLVFGIWCFVTTFFTMEVCSSGVPDQQRYHDLHHHKGLIVVVDPRRLKVAALAKK